VVGVVDGDTVDVLVTPQMAAALGAPPSTSPKPIRLRLYGIDAPEKDQPLGKDGKQALSELVFKKEVVVAVVTPEDYFGRPVALVFVDGTEVNEWMVRRGYAWAFRRYLGKHTKDPKYCLAEHEARVAQLGLWRGYWSKRREAFHARPEEL
jgi:endonuclease YncB( thermonuclease family)